MADSREKLFSDFSPVSTQDWMDKITVDLKGADYDKKLVWRTNEGFKVKPFYRKEDLDGMNITECLPGQFPYVRGNRKDDNTWLVRQNIKVADASEANRKALDVLNKGADSLGFVIEMGKADDALVHQLLDGICCDCIELNFTVCREESVDLTQCLVAYFEEKGYDANRLRGSIDYDPMGEMLSLGKGADHFAGTARILVELLAPYPQFRCIDVNAVMLGNAGAYIYQELGYALAWGNEYLSSLVEAGMPAGKIARKIKFNFGIGSNYFMEIAKFRAARMLWANLVQAYQPVCSSSAGNEGAKPFCKGACKMAIHAETSRFNMTLYDSFVNLLRSQTEAMSAALAGVDSMCIVPFDDPYAQSDEFSERIARNQQLLLKEEAHFDKVVDPAAGSYYIETLTASIAQQAWNLFLDVEDKGGMLKCIESGEIQNEVNEAGKKRHEAVSKRKETLLGTNQFPNFNEQSDGKQPRAAMPVVAGDMQTAVLDMRRAASEFEELRLQTERSGMRPKAFMLTIGNLAMRQARAQFSCNFLACAGYEVIDNLGFPSVEEGVNAAINAEADIIVLCSSDEEYEKYAIPTFHAINGRAMFIVAGAPACMDTLKAEGIGNFIHVRCNVLDTLKEYNRQLGIGGSAS